MRYRNNVKSLLFITANTYLLRYLEQINQDGHLSASTKINKPSVWLVVIHAIAIALARWF